MYQTGDTLKETLQAIQNNKFVLPAIQREFVWKPEQIARLFDSIMQGYPFGTFLFWKVDKPNSSKYKFYGFVRNYHERDQPHCPQLPTFHDTELTAVLDGQQRLTALSIGLSGSMAWRSPYKWKNNPNAYPVRRLYLDLLQMKAESEDGGERYCFEFLTDDQIATCGPDRCWFRVSDILAMQGGPPMLAWLNERLPQDKLTQAFTTLDELYRAVHDKHLISYYEEKSQQLEKVLNIFIRMNSGGTVLSYSDLLLSIAVAQWSGDARTEIHTLVDELNATGDGFNFSQDFVLKAGLMLAEIGNVGFKVENFNRKNMGELEKKWPAIKKALQVAVELVATFGFNEKTLRADSAVLPIAYYVCHRGLDEKYITKAGNASDRASIRSWLIRSLLKASGIWGSGLDTLLTALRECIATHGSEAFPVEKLHEVMNRRGKSLHFTQEEIEGLVEMQYGDNRLFAMLALLFPFVDVRNHFHIDHVFPQARFTTAKLKKADIPDEDIEDYQEMANCLPNLQLLEGAKNLEKLAMMPADWIENKFFSEADRTNYRTNHLLGEVPDSMAGFRAFFTNRREALRNQIVEMLAAIGSDDDGGIDSGDLTNNRQVLIDVQEAMPLPRATAYQVQLRQQGALEGTLNNSDAAPRRYWVIADGDDRDQWDNFYREGIVRITGRQELGNLRDYDSQTEVELALKEEYPEEFQNKNPAAKARLCYDFGHEVAIGDGVFVRHKLKTILGFGIAEEAKQTTGTKSSPYFFDADHRFPHALKVHWENAGSFPLPKDFLLARGFIASIDGARLDTVKSAVGGSKDEEPRSDFQKPAVQQAALSTFARIAKDIICNKGGCEILRTATKELRFIPASWAKVVPQNGTAWRRLSRPVSVSCWVELDNNTLSLKFEVSRMNDPALRLACVEGLRDASFALDTRAFREDAKYSRFYRESRKLQDSDNEGEVRAGIEELFGQAKEEFPKADAVFQRVFAEKHTGTIADSHQQSKSLTFNEIINECEQGEFDPVEIKEFIELYGQVGDACDCCCEKCENIAPGTPFNEDDHCGDCTIYEHGDECECEACEYNRYDLMDKMKREMIAGCCYARLEELSKSDKTPEVLQEMKEIESYLINH